MSQHDTGERSESGVEGARSAAGRGREYVAMAAPYLRRGLETGAVTGLVGGAGVLGGLRALRDGERERGLAGVAFGSALLTAAVGQWRASNRGERSDVDASDVVDTGTDVEAVADEAGGVGEGDHVTGEAAAAVADTSPDVGDASSGLDGEAASDDGASTSVDQRDVVDTGVDTDDLAEPAEEAMDDEATGEEASGEEATGDEATDEAGDAEPTTEAAEVNRLGEAAFDGQSREVPAPQRAFNQGFLAHSTEATWGIRSSDDAVLVSQDYDAIAGRDGVRYVASSEIGDDVRELPIPTAVLEHWDEVYGGGTAVTGGDDVLFVTTDDLGADHLLRVLPAAWADDAFGDRA